jgi:hypothetical protein
MHLEDQAMTAPTVNNGRPQRKQLSDQLDRLDTILAAIAADLPGIVTEACVEGARQAVKDAIVEIVSNPELRALIASVQPVPTIAAPAAVPEPSRPSLWARLKAKLAAARDAVTGAATKAKEAVTTQCRAATETVVAVGRATGESLNWQRILWISLCLGLAVGVLCLTVPQVVAATVSAASVTAASAAAQTGCWLRRAARRFGLVS